MRSYSSPFCVSIFVASVGCTGPQVQSTDDLIRRGLDQSLPHASTFRWQADFDRLIYDIPRAVQQLHWTSIAVRVVPPSTEEGETINAEALLPNGHLAYIAAWKSHDGFITVAARVGHFGDRRQEDALIAQLAKVLRGKPSRRHRQEFDLP